VARVCRDAVRRAATALAEAGCTVIDAAPPGAAAVREAFDAILLTELATLVAATPFEVSRLSRYGRMLAEVAGYETDLAAYVAAGVRLAELEEAADTWLDEHPLALCPTVPVPAPPASEGITTVDGAPTNPGGKMTLATYANALGLPAVNVPAGRDADGLPLGVQVLGRRGCDADVLAVARQLDVALGGWLDPADAPEAVIPPAG
jgi:Asp-tRNA(Asn)/Glu-tRNA(Gln) amidotransferase A subunit family amidase